MNLIFELAINILDSFLVLDFVTRYFGFKSKSVGNYIGFLVTWAISAGCVALFSLHSSYEIFSSLLQILINVVFCILYLKGSIGTQIFISTFTMCLVVLIAGFSTFLMGHIHDYNIQDIFTEFSRIRIITVLISKVLLFQATRIILHIKENAKLFMQDIMPLVVSPVLSICTVFILTNISVMYPALQEKIFYVVLLIIVFNFSTYMSFLQVSRSAKMKLDYELLNLQYRCAKDNARDIQNMYESIRSIRHDMENHLLCISSMLDDSPINIQKIRAYVGKLLKQQDGLHRKFVFSGNDALDAIINTKQTTALQYGIQINIVITHNLSFMAPEDICVLLGNLMDNAIRGAQNTDKKEMELCIQEQEPYVSIVVSNSINGWVRKDNPTLKTTKSGANHGYGILNIKKITQKYNGLTRFYESEDKFIADVLLLSIAPTDHPEIFQ